MTLLSGVYIHNRSEAECKRVQEDKGILEIELSVASERLYSETDNTITLKSQVRMASLLIK